MLFPCLEYATKTHAFGVERSWWWEVEKGTRARRQGRDCAKTTYIKTLLILGTCGVLGAMDRPKQASDYKYAVRCVQECIGRHTALFVVEGLGPIIRCSWLVEEKMTINSRLSWSQPRTIHHQSKYPIGQMEAMEREARQNILPRVTGETTVN